MIVYLTPEGRRVGQDYVPPVIAPTPETELDRYLSRFEPMQRGKVKAALLKVMGVNGNYAPRHKHAEAFAADPEFHVNHAKGRVYVSGGRFFEMAHVTKALAEYAEHLAKA